MTRSLMIGCRPAARRKSHEASGWVQDWITRCGSRSAREFPTALTAALRQKQPTPVVWPDPTKLP